MAFGAVLGMLLVLLVVLNCTYYRWFSIARSPWRDRPCYRVVGVQAKLEGASAAGGDSASESIRQWAASLRFSPSVYVPATPGSTSATTAAAAGAQGGGMDSGYSGDTGLGTDTLAMSTLGERAGLVDYTYRDVDYHATD